MTKPDSCCLLLVKKEMDFFPHPCCQSRRRCLEMALLGHPRRPCRSCCHLHHSMLLRPKKNLASFLLVCLFAYGLAAYLLVCSFVRLLLQYFASSVSGVVIHLFLHLSVSWFVRGWWYHILFVGLGCGHPLVVLTTPPSLSAVVL